jgi:Fur family transcriptional regulator, peroxide stress response regulator
MIQVPFIGHKSLQKPKNLRTTQQRTIILEELRSTNSHPSADELYSRVKKRLPRISLGTVYRNLEILSKLGEIQELKLSGSLKRYDWNPAKHYHIRCVKCDRVDDAPIAPLNQIEDDLYKTTVFEIIGHNLEFTGLCPDCSRKDREAQPPLRALQPKFGTGPL